MERPGQKVSKIRRHFDRAITGRLPPAKTTYLDYAYDPSDDHELAHLRTIVLDTSKAARAKGVNYRDNPFLDFDGYRAEFKEKAPEVFDAYFDSLRRINEIEQKRRELSGRFPYTTKRMQSLKDRRTLFKNEVDTTPRATFDAYGIEEGLGKPADWKPPASDPSVMMSGKRRREDPHGGALTGGGPTQVDEQLDDSDVKRVSGLPNLRVVRYPDMARFPTWDAMLGPAGAAAVLFLTESATSGHWLAAFNGPDDTAHIFDPLGIGLDKQKDELGAEKASELGQDRAEFSRLLKTTSRRPVVNHEDFQAFNPQVQTCGRWVGLRIAAKDMKDSQFKSMVERGIKATGAGSADDWVTKVTNPTLDSDDEGNTEF